MKDTGFEKLRVYGLAEKLADEVWWMVIGWDSFARNAVGLQLVRAADSVGANIAEGTGRGSFQDNRRFVRTARASLYETKHWLRRAHKRNLVNLAQVERLKPIIGDLAPMINAYLRSIGTTAKDGKDASGDAPKNGDE